MLLGWIVDSSGSNTRQEWRDQRALFHIELDPVWEVWFWHATLRRWFCMSHVVDTGMQAQGVVYFGPDEVPPGLLKQRVSALEQMAGIARA